MYGGWEGNVRREGERVKGRGKRGQTSKRRKSCVAKGKLSAV